MSHPGLGCWNARSKPRAEPEGKSGQKKHRKNQEAAGRKNQEAARRKPGESPEKIRDQEASPEDQEAARSTRSRPGGNQKATRRRARVPLVSDRPGTKCERSRTNCEQAGTNCEQAGTNCEQARTNCEQARTNCEQAKTNCEPTRQIGRLSEKNWQMDFKRLRADFLTWGRIPASTLYALVFCLRQTALKFFSRVPSCR